MTATRNESRIDEFCEALGVDTSMYLRTVSPYLTSEQVRALAAHGFLIGAHTVTHRHLGGLPADEIEAESSNRPRSCVPSAGRIAFPLHFLFPGLVFRDLS